MRTIIAGSRSCNNPYVLLRALDYCGWEPTTILCGMAKGADYLGLQYARDCQITLEEYPAHWDIFGKGAGKIRNAEMAHKAEALIALWDGFSQGTRHMIDTAKRLGLITHIELYDQSSIIK